MSSRTLYIRDCRNKTLADIEVSDTDVHAVLCCKDYSEFLLISVGFPYCTGSSDAIEKLRKQAARVIAFFDAVSELRGWYWERYRMEYARQHDVRANTIESIPYTETLAAIRTMLQPGMDALNVTFEED